MSTVYASITTPGPPGPPGRTPLWLTGPVAPVPAQGLDGDMYLQSTNGDVYGPKAGGLWGSIVANIRGATGAPGPTGATGYSPVYIVAAGVPNPVVGNIGDMYLNSTNSDIYGPKTAGGWGGVVANIKGATGATGPPGVSYTPRGAWSAATTYVQGDMVTDVSIIYIALQSANLNHVPLSSPTWWQPATQGGSQTPWTSDIDGAGFTLKNAGKIGIGVSVPVAHLDAAGTIRSTGVTTIASGAGIELAYASGAGFLVCYDRVASAYRVLNISGATIAINGQGGPIQIQPTGGNVGINQSNPTAKLHVVAPNGVVPLIIEQNEGFTTVFSAPSILLKNQNVTVGSGVGISAMNAGGGITSEIRFFNAPGAGVYPNNGGSIAFSTYDGAGSAGTERMRISAGGNVGIGTAAPPVPLSVYVGSVNEPSLSTNTGAITLWNNGGLQMSFGSNASGGWIQNKFSENDGRPFQLLLNPLGGNVGISTGNPQSLLSLGVGVVARKLAVYESGGDFFGFGVGSGVLRYDTGVSSDHVFYTFTNTERMRITSAGKIGIGTANPSGGLDVVQAVASRANVTFLNRGPGLTDQRMRLRLGPTNGFENTDLYPYIESFCRDATQASGLTLGTYDGVSSVERVRIAAEGLVGILEANPLQTLHVTGTGIALSGTRQVNYWRIAPSTDQTTTSIGYWVAGSWYPAGVAGLTLQFDGAVGIRKAAPGYSLDVTGDINCTGAHLVNGVAIGGGVTTQSIPGKTTNVTYRNTTGKSLFVCATVSMAGTILAALTDAAATPTTNVAAFSGISGSVTISFWVLNNNYYKVTAANGATYWIEWY